MQPHDFILKTSVAKLVQAGLPKEQSESIASTALGKFKKHELRNSSDIDKFLQKHITAYRRFMRQAEKDAIKRH